MVNLNAISQSDLHESMLKVLCTLCIDSLNATATLLESLIRKTLHSLDEASESPCVIMSNVDSAMLIKLRYSA